MPRGIERGSAMEDLPHHDPQADLSDERIEESLERRRVDKRGRILREVVDLFLERPEVYADAQLELFQRVIFKLIDQVDHEVRAHLSERLAPGEHTPPQIARHLA